MKKLFLVIIFVMALIYIASDADMMASISQKINLNGITKDLTDKLSELLIG